MQLLQSDKVSIGAEFEDGPDGRQLKILRADAGEGVDQGIVLPMAAARRLCALIHSEVKLQNERK